MIPGWLLGVFTFCISFFISLVVVKYSHNLGLLHEPHAKSTHKEVTPHGGGLAIVSSYLFASTILFFIGEISLIIWIVFACFGGVVAVVGVWDDVNHLAVRWRFLIYLFAVIAGVVLLGGLPPVQIGERILHLGLFGHISLIFLLIWWVNLYNFMDGIDALASMEAVFISLSAVLFIWFATDNVNASSGGLSLLLLLLAVAVLGFLVLNRPPAKLFMGDVGSIFLGFIIGFLALISLIQALLTPWVWLIIAGVFIIDTTVTLLQRAFDGHRWAEPHQTHAFKKSALQLTAYFEQAKQLSHKDARAKAHWLVNLVILFINVAWLLPMAYMTQVWPSWGLALVLMAWAPLVLLALFLRAGKD